MPIILKNGGDVAASVKIVETGTGNTDGITVMPQGKGVTLPAGWDVSPESIVAYPRLIVHRVADQPAAPAAPAANKGSKAATTTP